MPLLDIILLPLAFLLYFICLLFHFGVPRLLPVVPLQLLFLLLLRPLSVLQLFNFFIFLSLSFPELVVSFAAHKHVSVFFLSLDEFYLCVPPLRDCKFRC